MFSHLLSAEAKAFREEVRDLVKWVTRQMILDMDQDRIQFPKAFLPEPCQQKGGRRYPKLGTGCGPGGCGGRKDL